MTEATLINPSAIFEYHAHVYYDPATTRERAAALRAEIERRFPVRMGGWRDMPVGPHPQAMYQAAFLPDLFPVIVPWLALNRDGLDVLVHPDTGDAVADHARHAMWLGNSLPLNIGNLSSLRGR